MRSFVSPFAASAVLAIAILSSNGASAQVAAEPVICAPCPAPPLLLIQSCTALIENAATPEADRLDATITRAVALHNSGQTDKALAEIAAVIARDPDRARAFAPAARSCASSARPKRLRGAEPGDRLAPDKPRLATAHVFNNAGKYDRDR
jgi:hypothetical protein